MSVGHNTVSAEMLRSFVERLERLRGEKKQLGEDEKSVFQEAKSQGFDTKRIRDVLKIRAMKPHDRQEAEALLDMYLHALGMASEPPLFRAAGLASIDTNARDQVIARMREFVPAVGKGSIIVNWGGKALRLERDKDGMVHERDVEEAPAAKPERKSRPTVEKRDVPDVDAEGAEDLGREYARENRPVIDNPFPFGDARRARFDEGWRKETGSDGMGPDEP